MTEETRAQPRDQPSQVSFKTVFTVAFAALSVVGLDLLRVAGAVAVALTGAALLIAVSLEHLVRLLERRGSRRALGHRHRHRAGCWACSSGSGSR